MGTILELNITELLNTQFHAQFVYETPRSIWQSKGMIGAISYPETATKTEETGYEKGTGFFVLRSHMHFK